MSCVELCWSCVGVVWDLSHLFMSCIGVVAQSFRCFSGGVQVLPIFNCVCVGRGEDQ